MRIVLPAITKSSNHSYIEHLRRKYDGIIVLPELYSTSYNALDFLKTQEFINNVLSLQSKLLEIPDIIFGGIIPSDIDKKTFYNVAFYIGKNNNIKIAYKFHLPTYNEFYERRYFTPLNKNTSVIRLSPNNHIGLAICEDIWYEETWKIARTKSIKTLIAINASPYYKNKIQEKIKLFQSYTTKYGINLIYQNWYTSFDELTFIDRFIIDRNGKFYLIIDPVDIIIDTDNLGINIKSIRIDNGLKNSGKIFKTINFDEYKLITDYVIKNNMETYIPDKNVIIGISGGIDSSVVLALATKYNFNIDAYYLPTKYNSKDTEKSVKLLMDKYGVEIKQIPIDTLLDKYKELQEQINLNFSNIAIQNLQARIRGTILMTISNTTGAMLLACGNKTEYALGYATLYGDMSGGYAPIKDLWKTEIYTIAEILDVPEFIRQRKPSAELDYNQTDENDLGYSYDIIDLVLQQFIETGYYHPKYKPIIDRLYKYEFKRRQSPIGPKIQKLSFERDWLFPIHKIEIEKINGGL